MPLLLLQVYGKNQGEVMCNPLVTAPTSMNSPLSVMPSGRDMLGRSACSWPPRGSSTMHPQGEANMFGRPTTAGADADGALRATMQPLRRPLPSSASRMPSRGSAKCYGIHEALPSGGMAGSGSGWPEGAGI